MNNLLLPSIIQFSLIDGGARRSPHNPGYRRGCDYVALACFSANAENDIILFFPIQLKLPGKNKNNIRPRGRKSQGG
jgi:hypothetical protein